MATPRPTNIIYHQKSRELEISFDDGNTYSLSAEFLRVNSPSAEVQGHGPGQEVLQVGKENVSIEKIEAVGNYAVQLVFDDKHDTGIYSWEVLHEMGANHDAMWARYLERLKAAGHDHKLHA